MVTIFAVVGVILGYISKNESDRFLVFPYMGMLLNVAALACISVILYAGAYGI